MHSALHPAVLAEIYNARQAAYLLPALAKCRTAYASPSRLRGVPGACVIGDDKVIKSTKNVSDSASTGDLAALLGLDDATTDGQGLGMEEWEMHALQVGKRHI